MKENIKKINMMEMESIMMENIEILKANIKWINDKD
jgi:hypothetical protein